MQSNQATMFLQSLRGNQALVALAYFVIRQAMTIEDIEAATGLHNDTVRSAVKGLAAKGLLHKQVGEHGRQVWIPVADTFFHELSLQNPKTSDSALVVVNVESEESRNLYSTSLTNRRQNPRTSDSGGKVLSVKTIVKAEEDIAECMRLLNDAGIFGGKADEIAEDWHITAEMISKHLIWAKSEDWDNPNGMAIYRLINHVVPPELNANGHSIECKCNSCRILVASKRYSESAFSAQLNGGNDDQEESEEV